jgi:hypothetical protein
MSDTRRPSAPLLGSHSRSWLGFVALVLLAVAVLGYAYWATRPTQPANVVTRDAQIRLRLELEAKAREALAVIDKLGSTYGLVNGRTPTRLMEIVPGLLSFIGYASEIKLQELKRSRSKLA